MSVSNVLVIAATNSTTSINRRLAVHAAEILRDELAASVMIDVLDLNDYDMPVFSPERQAQGIPPAAQKFYDRIGASDGLIMSFAEYNGSYTAAFKNVFDWASRIDMKIYQNKPLLAMATSVGGRGGQNVLRTVVEAAPFFGANLTGQFNFGPFAEHFDTETGQLKTPDLARELRLALTAFQAAISK
ncbi:MAG: NADPH-dependent FMN reductase [Pseudomonadota bacterium]